MTKKSRKRKLDSEDTMVDWEKEYVMSDELHNEMKTMWEIPQIYHFLHLTKEALNIGPLSMYEMERMVMMPRASKQLAHIMTCLLSSPSLKTKLRRIPPMPYEYWTNILMHKIKSWFKIYHNKHEDAVKVLEATGVEPEFWKIFPEVSSIEGKDFEQMTFRQRVWLLKTVCDAMMHTRKTVQEEMSKQWTEETVETILGTDRYGARYIYFPKIMENDIRVYRHCLDNKILSTVEAPIIKVAEPKLHEKVNDTVKVLKSVNRSKRRKCRWRNGALPPRIKKRIKRRKEISNCEYTSERIAESLGSEDTNLSNASLYSNNNHTDLSSVRSKRSRSSSKNSEESLTSHSNQTKSSSSSHTKSSGYDTNTSNDAKSNDEMPFQKDFNGFSKDADKTAQNVVKKINTINSQLAAGRLDDIDGCTEDTNLCNVKTNQVADETDEKLRSNDTSLPDIGSNDDQSRITESELDQKSNNEPLDERCLISTDSVSTSKTSDVELLSNEILDTKSVLQVDELSKSSKTDDEKLNDIISVDNNMLKNKKTIEEVEETKSNVNMDEILSISKSDDQKLIETKLKDVKMEDSKNINDNSGVEILPSATDDDNSVKASRNTIFEVENCVQSEIEDKSNDGMGGRARRGPRRTVKSTYKRFDISEDVKSECSSDGEPTLSELRDKLIKDKDNPGSSCDRDIPVWEKYNLRKPTKIKKEEDREEIVENFQEMLDDLSFSTFELVADSIESLQELISNNFSRIDNKNTTNNASNRQDPRPQCELRLTKKIDNLIIALKARQPSLTDATKKARAKLHKEWSNFKEGVVEDQDWSSEGSLGLGSNWWVIGSQGCNPLLPTGDATISPLSQLTLSSPGTQHHQPHSPDDSKRENQEQDEPQEGIKKQQQQQQQQQQQSQEADGNQEETRKDETTGEQEQLQQSKQSSRRKRAIKEEKNEEEDVTSRRVLRARGVSSYMEQFSTSDDEIEEDELEGWPDFETKYTSARASPSIPVAHCASTSGQAETWKSEDSDQDWILPRARKRKNRRSVTRKLKSLQQKLQHISGEASSTNDREIRRDPNDKNENQNSSNISNKNANKNALINNKEFNQTVPSTPICRIESVHSEIDIKDELTVNQNGDQQQQSQSISNYNLNVQSGGYVVVKTDQCPMTNYYLMPQNTSVPGVVQQTTNIVSTNVVPQIQQGYYVQSGQNYFVQASQQANFISTQTLQQQQQLQLQQQQQQQQQQIIQTQQNRQQLIGGQNYMQMHPGDYVVHPQSLQPSGPRGFIVHQGPRPQLISAPQNIRGQLNVRCRGGTPLVGNGTPYPHGAVIRSSVPPRGNARNGKTKSNKNSSLRLIAPQQTKQKSVQSNNKRVKKLGPNRSGVNSSTSSNTTSLIVLSDSDDEIEMIITENNKKPVKTTAAAAAAATSSTNNNLNTTNIDNNNTAKIQISAQKPIVTSQVTISPANSILPPQIMQRMSQGGISITPVKTNQAQNLQNPNTQLVVVVNETGSHYALSLPNGSKLILTPEQVAQIRASNNGKLML